MLGYKVVISRCLEVLNLEKKNAPQGFHAETKDSFILSVLLYASF